MLLRDKSEFSLLGCLSSDLGSNGQFSSVGCEEEDDSKSSPSGNVNLGKNSVIYGNKYDRRVHECHKVDGFRGQSRQNTIGDNWIQLVWDSHKKFGRKTFWIPKLDHVRLNGRRVSPCDVHVCKSVMDIFVPSCSLHFSRVFSFQMVFYCGC